MHLILSLTYQKTFLVMQYFFPGSLSNFLFLRLLSHNNHVTFKMSGISEMAAFSDSDIRVRIRGGRFSNQLSRPDNY